MSLFGNSPFGGGQAQQQTGGGLFGQQSAPTTQQTGGLFGSNTPQQQGTTGGGLFGSSVANTTGTGGLFGQQQPQQQQQTGGGLFGQQQPQQQTGGGLFRQQQPQQQQSGGGLFGTQPQQQQQTGGGLFGGTSGQQQSGGGLFGQSQAQTGGGLFGGAQPQAGGGLFGQSQQQQPQNQSLFGGPQQNQLMGLSTWGGQAQNPIQQQQMQQGPNPIVEKIQRVKNAWDPSSSDYAFRYYFYNQIGEDKAVHYQRPLNEDSEAWEKAWAERPNKGSVPVLANGFPDLQKRVATQETTVMLYRGRLHEIQNKLATLQNHHDLQTSIKLEDCRRRHTALARRALSLAAKVQVLKNRGYALQPEEEQLKKRLEALAKGVQDPAVWGRVNEIWARMVVVSEKAKLMEEQVGKVENVWDEKQLQTTGRLLQGNAAGLEFLTKEVKEIEKQFAQWEEEQKLRPRGL
ncbi:hypothetical protein RUND412_001725 [Rhizina undulata]